MSKAIIQTGLDRISAVLNNEVLFSYIKSDNGVWVAELKENNMFFHLTTCLTRDEAIRRMEIALAMYRHSKKSN